MEIEVEEYVRTKEGYIGKLVEYIPEALNYLKIYVGREIKHSDDTVDNFIYTRYGFQLKHSKNIIDLIEEGDYVNGEKVTNVDKYDNIYSIEWEYGNVYTTEIINDKFIKSIVTKEQFKNIEYIVEE